jgi:PhzF family phenazine biosynthesis protein
MTQQSYSFKQVDVFTQQPFGGNPVAVVLEAEGLTDHQMQQIANWTNLSETTFVLPPSSDQADYRLRIFTPKQELPFAGHPTIGSAHAAIESGFAKPKAGQLRQECGAGIISLRVQPTAAGQQILAQAPPVKLTPLDPKSSRRLTAALNAEFLQAPMQIDVGPVWIIAELADAKAVAVLNPDMNSLTQISEQLQATGVTVFGCADDGLAKMQVRSFAPAQGIPEDPVCGSGNVSVAAYLVQTNSLQKYGSEYIARQGMQVGRNGQISIRIQDQQIEFGGYAVTCIDGRLRAR